MKPPARKGDATPAGASCLLTSRVPRRQTRRRPCPTISMAKVQREHPASPHYPRSASLSDRQPEGHYGAHSDERSQHRTEAAQDGR